MAAIVAFLSPVASVARDRSSLFKALNSITTAELRDYVSILADDTYEGRLAGSRGGRAAGGYLAREFSSIGLVGAGDGGGYFQHVDNRYRNILGAIHGSDQALNGEIILIGAHYDHVGYGTSQTSFGPLGLIHNGADDNASGVAAALEVAEAMVSSDYQPRRTILFALWDGEEEGLIGSKQWIENPTLPLDHVRFVVNLDMVGRLRADTLEVSGTRSAYGLRKLASLQNSGNALRLSFTWHVQDNSDHYPFFRLGIPILMLHTGLHEQYHRPSDDVERINFEGMQEISRLLFGILAELADSDELPSFRSESRGENERQRQQFEGPAGHLPPRLGISWELADSDTGVLVRHVVSGSPAERSGLRAGDRIEAFNGRTISDGNFLHEQVLASPIAAILLIRPRDVDITNLVAVTLDGGPIRVGISWRADDAEPESVTVVRVVPGSPADKAGLMVGDRLLELNGQGIENASDFGELIASLNERFDVVYERNGQIARTSLEPLSQEADSPESAPLREM